jgi:hypothetical protein
LVYDFLVNLQAEYETSAQNSTDALAGWRCKACGEIFAEYDEALLHADDTHPERMSIDPRHAVEASRHALPPVRVRRSSKQRSAGIVEPSLPPVTV